MPGILDFPQYFMGYRWEDKHHLFVYPADQYPEFGWISSLEQRFSWLKSNHKQKHTAAIYLLTEMIQWGGSQNGVLQKFKDRIGEVNVYLLLSHAIARLDSPRDAIVSALQFPGMGLTYAAKLLRFLAPDR